MYNRVFKNNQVTYGNPFKVNVPLNFNNIAETVADADEDVNEDFLDTALEPEEILERAKIKYDTIIAEAKEDANEIIEKAKSEASTEADSILEEAWQKGYAEGMEAAMKQNEATLQEAEQIRQSATQERDITLKGMEKEIVELALEIARKVVSCELETNEGVIFNLVEEALSTCSNKNNAVIRVSPSDCEYLDENKDSLLSTVSGADEIQTKGDNSLTKGDCVLETSFGSIDAGAKTKMDKIEEAFKNLISGE